MNTNILKLHGIDLLSHGNNTAEATIDISKHVFYHADSQESHLAALQLLIAQAIASSESSKHRTINSMEICFIPSKSKITKAVCEVTVHKSDFGSALIKLHVTDESGALIASSTFSFCTAN